MELFEVYTELERLVAAKYKPPVPPLSMVGAATRLLRQRRYADAPERVALLKADIESAASRLPEPERHHAEWILAIDKDAPLGWSDRVGALGVPGNRTSFREYAYRLMTLVAYELLRLWEADAAQTVANPLERVSYHQCLDIDEQDYRKSTLTRRLASSVTTPTLRYAILPYYYTVGPVPPDTVETLTPGQRYVGSVPEPLGNDAQWWSHIIQLERTYHFGETVTIAMRETYTDTDERLHSVNDVYGVHLLVHAISPRMERLSLAVRLPTALRPSAVPEARRANPPLRVPVKLADCPVGPDGWTRFALASGLQQGSEYGLFFPGTRLYP